MLVPSKNEIRKPTKMSADFIQQIIDVFCQVYGDYKIISLGKERSAAGKILSLYKKEFPESDSEKTLSDLKVFFSQCVNIEDPWLYDNMSLPLIVSKFNEISKILRNGKSKYKKGATESEILDSVAKVFATDYKVYHREHE